MKSLHETLSRLTGAATASIIAIVLGMTGGTAWADAQSVGTTFTYQGRLLHAGGPPSEPVDLVFRLYDAPSGGAALGELFADEFAIGEDGLFTIDLDFGAVFTGDERWLEIEVNEIVLSPRQPIMPSPYAIRAATVTHVPAGALGSEYDAPVTFSNSNNAFAGSFTGGFSGSFAGSGAGLLDLSASNITSGTLGSAHLSGTYSNALNLTSSSNVFSGTMFGDFSGKLLEQATTPNQPVRADRVIATSGGLIGGGSLTGNLNLSIATGGIGATHLANSSASLAKVSGGIMQASGGNIGIGTSNPEAPLHIASSEGGASILVPGLRVFIQDPDAFPEMLSPNIIGGASSGGGANQIFGGNVIGATISGGGGVFLGENVPNLVESDFGTIGGGMSNLVGGLESATIGGGRNNQAIGGWATIGGGMDNWAGVGSTIGGGVSNIAEQYATVGGGENNLAGQDHATIGGGHNNFASGLRSTIGGGRNHSASGANSTISGGLGNASEGVSSTVGGGQFNQALAPLSVVSGGWLNAIDPGAELAVIAGGEGNLIRDLTAGKWATISGGKDNEIMGEFATIGGGESNVAGNDYATISGGRNNFASGLRSTIGGGQNHQAAGNNATIAGGLSNATEASGAVVSGGQFNQALATRATIGGGQNNLALEFTTTVAGGHTNEASNLQSTVGGGLRNVASGVISTIAGGQDNIASSTGATVPGGRDNEATGSYSFAAGRRAHANHSGAFVWSDNSTGTFSSTNGNQFNVRASGGVRIYTNSGASTGVRLDPSGSSWLSVSDRHAKQDIVPVDPRDVLQQLVRVPISTWTYIDDENNVPHMGPMAQDFHAAFGLGASDKHISTIDADGVALAAIQGLYEVVQDRDAEIDALRDENASMRERIERLEALLSELVRESNGSN